MQAIFNSSGAERVVDVQRRVVRHCQGGRRIAGTRMLTFPPLLRPLVAKPEAESPTIAETPGSASGWLIGAVLDIAGAAGTAARQASSSMAANAAPISRIRPMTSLPRRLKKPDSVQQMPHALESTNYHTPIFLSSACECVVLHIQIYKMTKLDPITGASMLDFRKEQKELFFKQVWRRFRGKPSPDPSFVGPKTMSVVVRRTRLQ